MISSSKFLRLGQRRTSTCQTIIHTKWTTCTTHESWMRHISASSRLIDLEGDKVSKQSARKVYNAINQGKKTRKHTADLQSSGGISAERTSNRSRSKDDGRYRKPLQNMGKRNSREPFRSTQILDTTSKSPELLRFYTVLDSGDLNDALRSYNALDKENMIAYSTALGTYVLILSRALTTDDCDQVTLQTVLKAARAVQNDSISNSLPPSAPVYKRLLNLYKKAEAWSEGSELWKWMDSTPEDILHFSTYAAAIEFFTLKGAFDMAETVYQQALSSNDGSFLQYHLTPNAVLANRDEKFTSHFPQDTLPLISKILEARMRRGDHAGAYLLLDSILRVFMTADRWAFETIFHNSGSLTDRYALAHLALQAGVRISGVALGRICSDLVAFDAAGVPPASLVEEYVVKIQGVANLTIAAYNTLGTLDERMVNSIMLLLSKSLSQASYALVDLYDVHQLAEQIDLLSDALFPLLRYPATDHSIALVAVAGAARSLSLWKGTLAKSAKRHVGTSSKFYRTLLIASGKACNNIDIVKFAWQSLSTALKSEGCKRSDKDWSALLKAVVALDDMTQRQFMLDEAERLKHQLDSRTKEILESRTRPAREPAEETALIRIKASLAHLSEILATARDTFQRIRNDVDYKIDHNTLSTITDSSQVPLGSLPDMYNIYDKLTCDPAASEQGDYIPITYKQLPEHPILSQRFRNWATMTEVLVREYVRKQEDQAGAVQIENEDTGLVAEDKTTQSGHAIMQQPKSLDELELLIRQARGMPPA